MVSSVSSTRYKSNILAPERKEKKEQKSRSFGFKLNNESYNYR